MTKSKIIAFIALLFIQHQSASAIPLGSDFYDDFEEEINNLRTESWNISQGQPDYAVGEMLENWTSESQVFPEEMGTYHEGDILFLDKGPEGDGRNGIIGRSYRWTGGIVYYKISGAFSRLERRKILQAMNEYHRRTCIKFKPYTGHQPDHIIIKNARSGCWSAVGRTGGRQYVNLQVPGCTTLVGTIIHELMHTIGFWHEQSRLDRDQHVQILWNNVRSENRHNFNKARSTTFGVPYDYMSVMHYSGSAFSRNGRPTIIPRRPGILLGQRNSLSKHDIAKINAMYKCRRD